MKVEEWQRTTTPKFKKYIGIFFSILNKVIKKIFDIGNIVK